MEITLKRIEETNYAKTVAMITDFFNYHRMLTDAPKKFWQVDDESANDLEEWLNDGEVYNIYVNEDIVGFVHIRYGGQAAAWLEDIYVKDQYRGKGIGRLTIAEIDKLMREKDIKAMFVDVIPRNTSAIKLYKQCGFDHLNMIQLRKNYDTTLNKDEDVELLGFKFKKY